MAANARKQFKLKLTAAKVCLPPARRLVENPGQSVRALDAKLKDLEKAAEIFKNSYIEYAAIEEDENLLTEAEREYEQFDNDLN